MSMYPQEMGPIPAETMRVAHAAYPKGELSMRLRDELGGLSQDEQFRSLFPSRGQPAQAPWRLAIVLVLQYVEGLTDRQAAECVRGRIDWKYALGLELSDPGFDASVLTEFRERLVAGQAESLLLDVLLSRCKERGWLKAGGKQRSDSTHVLARVRSLSNLECVGETRRSALDDLAALAPEWLVKQISPDWLERYSHRVENYRLRHPPKASAPPWQSRSVRMGCICCKHWNSPMLPACSRTRLVSNSCARSGSSITTSRGGKPAWRAGPQAKEDEGIIRSPYDPQARTGNKRETTWSGFTRRPDRNVCRG